MIYWKLTDAGDQSIKQDKRKWTLILSAFLAVSLLTSVIGVAGTFHMNKSNEQKSGIAANLEKNKQNAQEHKNEKDTQ
jgi:hypothetical protein